METAGGFFTQAVKEPRIRFRNNQYGGCPFGRRATEQLDGSLMPMVATIQEGDENP
jgi:hypothetical protein